MKRFASSVTDRTAGLPRRETRCWRTRVVRSSRSSTTMTRACLTGWNSSTDDCRITSRRIPLRQSFATRIAMSSGQASEVPTSHRVGIGRVPPAPSGPMVADYVLGLVKDDGRHSWGMLGSGTLMARTDALRDLGGFDARFRRCAERDLAVRAALEGAHFISVDAPLVTQYLTPTADKAGRRRSSSIAFCSSRSIDAISRRKRRLWARGATCMPSSTLPRTALVVAAVVYRRTRPLSVGRVPGAAQALLDARPAGDCSPHGWHRPDRAARTLSEFMAPYADEEARGRDPYRASAIDRVIILNCYGRGGSGIVWRMIGSSPDVIMTSEEWHVGVFGPGRPCAKDYS